MPHHLDFLSVRLGMGNVKHHGKARDVVHAFADPGYPDATACGRLVRNHPPRWWEPTADDVTCLVCAGMARTRSAA